MRTLKWYDTIYDEQKDIELEIGLNIKYEIEAGYTTGPMEPDKPPTIDVCAVEVASINAGSGEHEIQVPADEFFASSSEYRQLLPDEDEPYFEHAEDMADARKADRADQIRDRKLNR